MSFQDDIPSSDDSVLHPPWKAPKERFNVFDSESSSDSDGDFRPTEPKRQTTKTKVLPIPRSKKKQQKGQMLTPKKPLKFTFRKTGTEASKKTSWAISGEATQSSSSAGCFNDRHPSSFVFVTPEGMVGAKLEDGLRRHDDVLILSSIELWNKFSTDLYQILSKLPAEVVKTPPNSEKSFNALIWVKATFVSWKIGVSCSAILRLTKPLY